MKTKKIIGWAMVIVLFVGVFIALSLIAGIKAVLLVCGIVAFAVGFAFTASYLINSD